MTAWADLISKLQMLDDLAKKFQSEPPHKQTTPKDKIETFQAEYQEWYTDCLSSLEGELKIQFQLLYEAYAKSFVLFPTDVISGKRGGYTTLAYRYTYRYQNYFQKAAFEHKTLLLQAIKMQKIPTSKTPTETNEIINSMTDLKPVFNQAALKYLANIIEERFTIDFLGNGIKSLMLPDTREMDDFFKRAGFNVDSLNASEGAVYKWLKEIQNLPNGHDKIFHIVMQLCDPLEYFEEEKKHDAILKQVNQVLQQYGRIAHKNGQIHLLLLNKNSGLSQSLHKVAKPLEDREGEQFEMQKLPKAETQTEAIEIIKSMATNFHLFVHYLNTRHDGGTPFINIQNEYDVQDIFHGLLRLFFKDIRPEEGAPSHAGKNSRIDFFLPQEQIIVEIKKTRANLKDKKVGEELTLDIIYYQKQRGYNTFIGFVYDPNRYIKNPSGLANDLQQTIKDIDIIIIINQS